MANTIAKLSNQQQDTILTGSTAFSVSDPSDAFSLGLSSFWRVIKRSYKLLAAILIIALLIGIAATLLAKPVYRATSVIRFESAASQTIQISNTGTTIGSSGDFERESQTQIDLIRSRAMAQAVYEQAKLGSNAKFLEVAGISTGSDSQESATAPLAKQNAAIGFLRSSVHVEKIAGTQLTNIQFDSRDPQLAALIANAYARAAVQLDLQHKFDGSSYARDFLTNQLKLARERLERSEVDLNSYIAENGLISVRAGAEGGETTTIASNLASSATTANDATNQRIAAEQAWRATQAVPLMSVPQVLADPQVQGLKGQLAAAKAKLRQDRATYGLSHPTAEADQEAVNGLTIAAQTAARDVVNGLRAQFETAQHQEAALLERVNGLKGSVISEERLGVRSNILKRDVDTNRSLYDALLQRQKEVSATAGVNRSSVSIIDDATVPGKPVSPNLPVNLAVALVAGLFFGLLTVLIKSQLDQKLRTPEDISAATGLPILGVIPKSDVAISIPDELDNPRSALSEAFFSARTHIALSRPNGLSKTLSVTSSREGEGKSTTAYALARTIAKMDLRVLVIDADLRRPATHRFFGLANKLGLAELLSANAVFESVIQATDFEKLHVITSGTAPPSPTELLSHSTLDDILAKARESYDVVIIDGPPILGMADALLLAAKVDGVIFVAEAEGGTRASLRRALLRLATASPDVLGVIVEKFSAEGNDDDYYYSYNYSYTPKPS
ncbi:GumC family protein [Sphingomonas faeni]|uniref:GumC family protein n=1 Tax=Sphingomonas faeni TaxID=185950 RepID=UPI0027837F4E|nr:polysaccharide biosynthesis tyrosine autokinase [Sphingomonas faeni]MDQ0838834.1 succinoglycan biosynthesis transport protein ExoP [Sphingomonas faeni]